MIDKKNSVAMEVLRDLTFCVELIEMQNSLHNVELKVYYSHIELEWLSIVLHECIQAKLIDKNIIQKKYINILKYIRQRVVKTSPSENGTTVQLITEDMGIDYGHYIFDLIITLNEKDKQKLFGVNFSHWDIDSEFRKNYKEYNELLTIPYTIISYILANNLKEEKQTILKAYKIYNKKMVEAIENKIKLERYCYSSGVFFRNPEISSLDKQIILYYYTFFFQAHIIDELLPSLWDGDKQEYIFGCMKSKVKYRAVIIENFGQFIMKQDTPLSVEIKQNIENTLRDKSFFSQNRKIRNNIHYKVISPISKEELNQIHSLQNKYIDCVLLTFSRHLKYKIGTNYKFIKWLAFHTDTTIQEVRRKNKSLKCYEEITEKEWKEARERIDCKSQKLQEKHSRERDHKLSGSHRQN